jgi:hypothetical protein
MAAPGSGAHTAHFGHAPQSHGSNGFVAYHPTFPKPGCLFKEALMAKGEQRSNKMAKKPKKDTAPPKTFTSDRPVAPTTVVAPRGKVKDK